MNIDQAPRAMWQNINCSIPKAFVCESDTVTAGSTTVAAISTSTTYPPVTNPSPGFQQAANILLTGIDTTIDPCDDFYAFTCGKWLHDNPLPDGASRYGTYDMSQERIDTIIAQKLNTTDFSNPNTTDTERAATNYFKACVDNYNDDSTSNAQTLRSAIAATTLVGFPLFEPNWTDISADDLWSAIGMLESQYALGTYFESFVSVDYGDVSRNALYINQGGLLMARDFYVKPQFNRELNAYLTMTFELLQAYRYDLNVTTIDDVTLMNECQALIAFERQLAFAMAPDELLRNYQQQYNDFSLDRLNSSFPQIRWDSYLRSLLARVNPNYIRDSFVIVEPGYVNALNSLAISTPMRTLVNFAIVRFIYDNAQFLGPSYRKARRTFEVIQKNSGSIRGRRRPLLASDAEQNCVELLSAYMPYSTGL
jgi:predicted metalloendopeptidase